MIVTEDILTLGYIR